MELEPAKPQLALCFRQLWFSLPLAEKVTCRVLASSEQQRALLLFVQKLGLVSRLTRCLQCRE